MGAAWSIVPWAAILFVVLVTLACVGGVMWRSCRGLSNVKQGLSLSVWICSISSIWLVVLVTTVGRPAYGARDQFLNLVPFRTIANELATGGLLHWMNLIANVGLFIPVGFFLTAALNRTRVAFLVSLVVSFSVEVVQYLTAVGSADVDDVILNSLGAGVGIFAYRLLDSTTGISAWRAPSGT